MVGAKALQGWHQLAEKSTRTGTLAFRTVVVKFESVSSVTMLASCPGGAAGGRRILTVRGSGARVRLK